MWNHWNLISLEIALLVKSLKSLKIEFFVKSDEITWGPTCCEIIEITWILKSFRTLTLSGEPPVRRYQEPREASTRIQAPVKMKNSCRFHPRSSPPNTTRLINVKGLHWRIKETRRSRNGTWPGLFGYFFYPPRSPPVFRYTMRHWYFRDCSARGKALFETFATLPTYSATNVWLTFCGDGTATGIKHLRSRRETELFIAERATKPTIVCEFCLVGQIQSLFLSAGRREAHTDISAAVPKCY